MSALGEATSSRRAACRDRKKRRSAVTAVARVDHRDSTPVLETLERGRVSAPVAARRDVRAGFGELGVRSERGRSVGVRATRARTKIAPGPGRERSAGRGRYFPERHGAARRRIAPLILRVAEARRRSTTEDWEKERERDGRGVSRAPVRRAEGTSLFHGIMSR